MLDSSKDILNIALAISVFGLAFILGWILIYFLMIIRHLIKMIQSIEERLNKIDDFLNSAKGKFENILSFIPILAASSKQIIEFFASKKSRSKK